MHVIVDSLMTHYTRQGEGKTVVLLHGWADSAATFKGLCRRLEKQYDVIALDLPGFGGSAQPRQAWDLDDYALFISQFLQKIDVQKVSAFIGHSNGGAIAIRGLATNILASDKLVLLASAGIRGTKRTRNLIVRNLTKLGKVITSPLPAHTRQQLRRGVYRTIGSDMLVAASLQETFKKVVGQDVRKDAAAISIPTLLVYGETDSDTPLWYGQQYNKLITHSTLTVLPKTGHFVHAEQPEAVAAALEGFLA